MRTINSLLQASLKIDLAFLVEDAMHDTASGYVDLQKQQLFAGTQSDASQITRLGASYPVYAPSTVKAKIKKGQPVDRVTLKDTSSFYDGIFAEARSEGFAVDSLDPKSGKLQSDYGPKIFGLDEDYRSQYAQGLIAVLLAKFENVVNQGTGVPQSVAA